MCRDDESNDGITACKYTGCSETNYGSAYDQGGAVLGNTADQASDLEDDVRLSQQRL